MAARKTAASPKPDKLIRDAILIELHADSDQMEHGKRVKKLRLIARALIKEGIAGDVAAIKEIADRVEGKAAQGILLSGDPANPLEHRLEVSFVQAKE